MRLGRAFLCFLFAVGGSADLDTNVRYFETLESDDLHVTSITKRSADGKLSRTKHIRFRTLGREFNLVLYPGSSVLSSKFRAVTVDKHGKNEPFYINRNDFYSGHLAENSSVEVTAHFEDGVLSSSIHFHNDTYVVEPAWRHRKPSENFTMISYRGSDVNWDEILPFDPKTGKRTKLKDGIRLPEGSAYNTQQAYGQNATYSGGDSRHKRGAVEKNTCPLLVVADYYFFKDMGNNKRQTSAAFIISTIQKVNVHYKRTVFDADNGFYDMGFQIDEMKIYVQFTNKPGHFNSDQSWSYNPKLYAFSRSPTNNRFCLAHLFTSYAMPDNVLGLAFIAPESLVSAGGICTVDTQLEGAKAYPRTGWTSSKNTKGLPVLSLQHELVVTHELGHNWGAEHDPLSSPECNPRTGGQYIMWGFSVPGYEENNQHFSPCSLRWVAPVLRAKSGLCFRSKQELQSLCGNGIVEEKEECDVGFVEKDQEEKCCDENCQFKPNVTCSDFNAPCCKDCMVANRSIVCEQKNELTCTGEAFCDGRKLDCPPPSYLPDNTSCVDLGKCQGGRCLNFCELRGIEEKKTLKPCLCSQNTTAMCRRCCLEEKGDEKGECFPTLVVQEDGRTCQIGKCEKGECVKVVQELSHRIYLFIQHLNTDGLVEFMKSNIVGTVIVLSLVVWIPVSCIVSCADKRKRNKRDKFRERLRKANQEAQVKDYRIRNSALKTATVPKSVPKSSQITGNKAQLQQSVRQKLVQKGVTGGPVSGRLPTVRETTRDGAAGSKGKPQGGYGAQSGQKPYGGYGPRSGKGPPSGPRPPSGIGILRGPRPPSGSGTPSGPRPPSGVGTPRMPRPQGGSGTPSGTRPPGGSGTPRLPRHESGVDVGSHSTSPRPISMPANKSLNARRVHSDSSSDTGSQRSKSQESPDTLQLHSGRAYASVDPHKHISPDAGGHKLALLDQHHSRGASAHNRKDSKGSDTGSPKGEKAGGFQHPSDDRNRHEDEGRKGDGGP